MVAGTLTILPRAHTQVPFFVIGAGQKVFDTRALHPPALLGVQQAAVAPDRSLFVSDKLDNAVKVFDLQGGLLLRFGSSGRQPGKFRGPAGLAVSRDRIAVADFAAHRFQVFDLRGGFLFSGFAPGPIIELAYDPDGMLWAAIFAESTDNAVICFDSDGLIRKELRLKNSSTDAFDNLVTFAVTSSGKIVVGYRFRNLFEVWDTSGRFHHEFQLAALPPRPASLRFSHGILERTIEVPEESIIENVDADASDNLFILGGVYSINPHRDVYCTSITGRLQSVYLLPEEASAIRLDKRAVMYAIGMDRNVIKGYRITDVKVTR